MLNDQLFDLYKVILNTVFQSVTIRCNFDENDLQILDPDESQLFLVVRQDSILVHIKKCSCEICVK